MARKKSGGSSRTSPESLKRDTARSTRERREKYAKSAAERSAGREAEKPMRDKSRPRKKKKFRGGNYSLYYILAFIILAVVVVILANTVLFNCSHINVSGNNRYQADEIREKSGLQLGENLLRVNTSEARDNIVNSLAYVDDAEVKKSFPTNIDIFVVEAEKQYCVSESGVTAAISRKGKILEHCQPDGLPVVKGFDAESLEVGTWLKSKTDGKTEIPDIIFKAADKTGLKNVTEVDITDKFSVKIVVENRVILELGPAEEVESKLLVAVEIITNQIGKDEYVTLLLTNPEKVPVKNNSVPQTSKPAASSTSASSATSAPVSQPTPDPDPEQTQTPEPDPEQTQTPEPDPEQTQTPEPDPEQTQTPEPDPEQTQTPEPDPEQTQTPEPDPEQTQTPEPDPEQTQTPAPDPGQVQTPEPDPEQTQTPEPDPAQTQTPDPDPEQTQTPEPDPTITE